MVSPQYFFVREIEQMNYFCSAYPEVVKGEVGQSHAGDVFWELLQDLRVLCLQVDKKNEAYHFIKTPQIHSMLLTKSNTYDACSSCLFYETLNVTTYAGLSDLYFEYLRGSQSLVVVALDERLLCAGEIPDMQFIWITVITLNTFLIQIWGIESGVCCTC